MSMSSIVPGNAAQAGQPPTYIFIRPQIGQARPQATPPQKQSNTDQIVAGTMFGALAGALITAGVVHLVANRRFGGSEDIGSAIARGIRRNAALAAVGKSPVFVDYCKNFAQRTEAENAHRFFKMYPHLQDHEKLAFAKLLIGEMHSLDRLSDMALAFNLLHRGKLPTSISFELRRRAENLGISAENRIKFPNDPFRVLSTQEKLERIESTATHRRELRSILADPENADYKAALTDYHKMFIEPHTQDSQVLRDAHARVKAAIGLR